ncbi:hypothetical protein [Pedobacter sp.]
MKKHLLKISVVALLLVGNWGCRKDGPILVTDELKELKSFYNQNKPDASSIFRNTSPNWSEVSTLGTDGFTVYEVHLDNPDRVGLMSNISKTKEPTEFENTHGLKMLFFVEGNGKVAKGCYMAVEASTTAELAEVHYKNAGGLNGNVIYYKLDGTMSNGIAYVGGRARHRISYLPDSEMFAIKNGDGSRMAHGCTMRYIETGYYYCVFTPYSENCGWQSTGYSGFPVCDNSGGYVDNDVEQGFEGGSGDNVNSSSNIIPLNPYLPGYDKSPIDPKKYANCFKNIQNAGATYKVVVQVQEPTPGIRLNYGVNGVGHTAITLIKKGSNGVTVSQTIGFYPSGNKFSSPSKMVDNAKKSDENNNIEFTVSMEFDLAGNVQAFNKILDGISNPPAEYEL